MIGECDIGCNEGAKSSMDHTYLTLAAYRGASVHARAQLIGRTEILGQPVAAGGVAVVLHHTIPEESGREEVARVTGVGVSRR